MPVSDALCFVLNVSLFLMTHPCLLHLCDEGSVFKCQPIWRTNCNCHAKASIRSGMLLITMCIQSKSGLSSAGFNAQTDVSACGRAGVEEGALLARLCSSIAVPLAAGILLQDPRTVDAVALLSGAPFWKR